MAMLTKEHKLRWDAAKRRSAWESREQHRPRPQCVSQHIPSLIVAWSVAAQEGMQAPSDQCCCPPWQDKVWKQWLGLLAEHERLLCMPWLAQYVRAGLENHRYLNAGKGMNCNKDENQVVALCGSGGPEVAVSQ